MQNAVRKFELILFLSFKKIIIVSTVNQWARCVGGDCLPRKYINLSQNLRLLKHCIMNLLEWGLTLYYKDDYSGNTYIPKSSKVIRLEENPLKFIGSHYASTSHNQNSYISGQVHFIQTIQVIFIGLIQFPSWF